MSIRIELGKPETGWLNTAICNQQYPCLSSNDVSYWCYVDKYGFDLKIGRNTLGAARIQKGIIGQISVEKMEKLLLELVLPHITPDQFVTIMDSRFEEGLQRGKQTIRRAINNILREE